MGKHELKREDLVYPELCFDFLIDEKVIVELKKNFNFSKAHIDQVLNYLKVSKLKLAILINFGKEGAAFKRIVNIK